MVNCWLMQKIHSMSTLAVKLCGQQTILALPFHQSLAVQDGDTPLAHRIKANLSTYTSNIWVAAILSAQNAALAIDELGSPPTKQAPGPSSNRHTHVPHAPSTPPVNAAGRQPRAGPVCAPGPGALRKVYSEPIPATIDLGNGRCLTALDEGAVVRELVDEHSRLLVLEHEVGVPAYWAETCA
jgi:hypothetical protein